MTDPSEIAVLHTRLLETSADYKALTALVDERIEHVVSTIAERPRTFEEYMSHTGELRGLRNARGASTVKRGQK